MWCSSCPWPACSLILPSRCCPRYSAVALPIVSIARRPRSSIPAGIEDRGRLAIETMGSATAEYLGQHLDGKISEHAGHGQEEHHINPEALAPGAHDVGDAGDFEQQDEEVIGHGPAGAICRGRQYGAKVAGISTLSRQ